MTQELVEYTERLQQIGDPNAPAVREIVEHHQGDAVFQEMVHRINSLFLFESQISAGKSKRKTAPRKASKKKTPTKSSTKRYGTSGKARKALA